MTQLPDGVSIDRVHSCSVAEDGRTICMWLDLSDGTSAFLQFTPGNPPGETTTISLH